MKSLNWKFNAEYNNYEATFTGKLVSVSDQVFENVNGTNYLAITGESEGTTFTGIMYEANYVKGVEVGQSYDCRAVYNPEREGEDVLIIMSHFTTGERLKASSLGLNAEAMATAKAKALKEAAMKKAAATKAEEYQS